MEMRVVGFSISLGVQIADEWRIVYSMSIKCGLNRFDPFFFGLQRPRWANLQVTHRRIQPGAQTSNYRHLPTQFPRGSTKHVGKNRQLSNGAVYIGSAL